MGQTSCRRPNDVLTAEQFKTSKTHPTSRLPASDDIKPIKTAS